MQIMKWHVANFSHGVMTLNSKVNNSLNQSYVGLIVDPTTHPILLDYRYLMSLVDETPQSLLASPVLLCPMCHLTSAALTLHLYMLDVMPRCVYITYQLAMPTYNSHMLTGHQHI